MSAQSIKKLKNKELKTKEGESDSSRAGGIIIVSFLVILAIVAGGIILIGGRYINSMSLIAV